MESSYRTYSTYGGLCLRDLLGWYERSYHVNCTRSRPIPEVNLRRVQPVVRCVSTCEAWILFVLPLALLYDENTTTETKGIKIRKIKYTERVDVDVDVNTHVTTTISVRTGSLLWNLHTARTVRTVDCVCAISWAGMNGHIT